MGVVTAARRSAQTERERLLSTGSDATLPDAALDAALQDARLTVEPLPPGDHLLAGAVAALDPLTDCVYVRASVPPAERRFLVAHELAHFYLHPEYVGSDDYEGATIEEDAAPHLVGYGPRERREAEANVWAREFLLPASVAHRRFDAGETAGEIAAQFGVAPSVVYRQLQAAPLGEALFASPAPPSPPLDASQRNAAHRGAGAFLLRAGPGTGKTRTLVARAAHLLESGVAPENLLCLTFSRKAAEQLRERTGEAVGAGVSRRIAVCTFHAFGLDLLRRYYHEAGLPPRPTLLTQAELFALLETRLGDVIGALWSAHDPLARLPDALKAIARLKEEMVTPDEARARADSPEARAVAAVYARTEETLREHGALDSADLVCRAVSLLQNRAVRERERERWRHILVDEYQDVNRAGAHLVRLLAGDTGGVWCVGDERQSIYAFRGASPANVTRFATDFENGTCGELAVNYRSRAPLVALFGQLSEGGAAFWQAAREQTGAIPAITLAISETGVAQNAGIARTIHALRAEHGYAWCDFAVLCRSNAQAAHLRAALAAAGVSVAPDTDRMAWLRAPDVRELLLLLSLTDESEGALARRVGRELPAALRGITRPAPFLHTALWGEPRRAPAVTDPDAVQTLLALAETWGDTGVMLCAPGENQCAAFVRHVRRIARLRETPRRETGSDAADDGVSVMTVHAAKGLEFPVVFVPNLSQGRFPMNPRPDLLSGADWGQLLGGETDARTDEEARLFFVAVTRARDHLYLTLAEKYDGRAAQPSPLIAPLETVTGVEKVRWREETSAAASDVLPVTQPPEPLPSVVLAPLSGHDLDRYKRCPRRYYFETVRGYGALRSRTGYDVFKATVRAAVKSAAAEGEAGLAFAPAWEASGLLADDPWRARYVAEADAAIAAWRESGGRAATESFTAEIAGESVTVRADAIAADGAIERMTFAKARETGASDGANTLLLAAAPAGTAVRVRHIRTGETRAMEPATHSSTKKARANHLAEYERAVRGIRLRVFPAEPSDADDCAACAYLLICGETPP